MLASLYRYGKIAFVGGGFQRGGIHNVLEPAVFGLPVIIGPVYTKFVEAVQLVSMNCCFPVRDISSFRQTLSELSTDKVKYETIHSSLVVFMKEQAGATNTIMGYIEKSGWLSSPIGI
jgi:3-deoxy-D-manno-octulosonic-acid transferase